MSENQWHETYYHFMDLQCLTMSFESTSAPWDSNKRTMAVFPSWAAMWSGVRSTFVLASRDIPARRSTSAVLTWPYWAARWSGLVPSCQQIQYMDIYYPRRSHKNFVCFSIMYSWTYSAINTDLYLYFLLSLHTWSSNMRESQIKEI